MGYINDINSLKLDVLREIGNIEQDMLQLLYLSF